jgi:formylglycine-generating enzyme required for sulfatase activity
MGLVLLIQTQWEHACRAGRGVAWSDQDVAGLRGRANVADEGAKGSHLSGLSHEPGWDDGHAVHAPVGSFLPNPWGLFDIHGNVWEWCRDEYRSDERSRRPGEEPLAAYCGGSFLERAESAQPGARGQGAPTYRKQDIGVRPARPVR